MPIQPLARLIYLFGGEPHVLRHRESVPLDDIEQPRNRLLVLIERAERSDHALRHALVALIRRLVARAVTQVGADAIAVTHRHAAHRAVGVLAVRMLAVHTSSVHDCLPHHAANAIAHALTTWSAVMITNAIPAAAPSLVGNCEGIMLTPPA